MPPLVRLRRSSDFVALRRSNGRCGSRCFSVRYRRNEWGYARLGLAVSKRVSKRAVERNRIKRLLRESFRRTRDQLPAFDLMVIAREQTVGRPGPELLADLEILWGRLKSLKDNA